MGLNSTVVVHNDSLHVIREDPDFGKNLAEAIMHLQVTRGKIVSVPSKNHVNAAEAIESHHADIIQLIAVGTNTAWVLPGSTMWGPGFEAEKMKEEVLRDFADNMGYRLVKKYKPPTKP